MVDNENIIMDYWYNISTTHFTYNCSVDCSNPYWRVYNGNTILGLVDSGFDITYYPHSKTNPILFIAKMGVLNRTLIFSREKQTTL